MNDNSRAPWYAVITKPSREVFAAGNLKDQGYEPYLPLCIEPGREGPLLPRYLFIQPPENVALRPVDNTPGVSRLMRGVSGNPLKVPQFEIDRMKAGEDATGKINLVKPPEHLTYESDQELRITDGPFAGHIGIYKGLVGKDRVKLFLDLIGRTEVELPAAQVRVA